MVNVMGDALATGIMAHICRKDFMKEGDGVSFNSGLSPNLLLKTQNHVHFSVSLNVRVNNILPLSHILLFVFQTLLPPGTFDL